MGIIRDGIYYPDEVDDHAPTSNVTNSIATAGAYERMYDDHAHELIQPHNPDGTPNEDFVEYYPDVAKTYGFINEEGEQ